MKKITKVVLSLLGAAAITTAAFSLYALIVTAGIRLDSEKLKENTVRIRVYDACDNETNLPALKEQAELAALPEYVPNAFVAVEDKRFYSHRGFDVKRIGKAILKNVATLSFREGASTISQQLIKNTHLSGEKTLKRKLREMKLTRQLEQRYSKREILSLYLNSIYFGHSAFGIGKASAYYFNKSAEKLTPAESALFAALVKSPNRYSPFINPEKCLERRNFVLSLMKNQGYLDETAYKEAVAQPLPDTPNRQENNGKSYLSRMLEELAELFPAQKIDGCDWKIYTFFDEKVQSETEKCSTESDCIAMVTDNALHGVKAYYSTAGSVRRLPASLLKPLFVYAPAIEENLISPATPILDEETSFGSYTPRNYGGYEGYVSARYALSHSLNVPAVKLLNALGVDRAADYAKKLNLPVPDEDKTLALALGGMQHGYSLCALSDGYTALANGGLYAPSRLIRRIESASGRKIYEYKPREMRVFSEDTAFLITDMLKDAVQEGTAKKLRSLGYPIAAKTGTGANTAGNTDAYTVSYTARDTVAVWMGNNDYSPIQTTGGNAPAALVYRINRALYENAPPQDFAPCDSVVRVAFDKDEYEKNHAFLRADSKAPAITTLSDYFRLCAVPPDTSTKFSCPTIQKPTIFVKNGTVCIQLCQTEYYDYVIKRRNRGKTVVIYRGKYQKAIFDSSVQAGQSYVYSVTPVYEKTEGKPVELPSVFIPDSSNVPDGWWD